MVVEASRCERLKPQHPIIFPLFEEPPIFLGCSALFDLLDERECSVFVEVVSWQQEVVVISIAFWSVYVTTVAVDSQMCRR